MKYVITVLFVVVAVLGCYVILGTKALSVEPDVPTVLEAIHPKEDQVKIVGRYCIDGMRVVHYNIYRWSDRYNKLMPESSHGGHALEFSIHYGNC